MEEDKNDS